MSTQENKANSFINKFYSILKNSSFEETLKFDESKGKIYIFDREKMHGNFSSFIRQLNLYGFKKIKNNGHTCFTHPKLLKGEKFLSIVAKRKEKSDQDLSNGSNLNPKVQNKEESSLSKKIIQEIQDNSGNQIFRNSSDVKNSPSTSVAIAQSNIFPELIPQYYITFSNWMPGTQPFYLPSTPSQFYNQFHQIEQNRPEDF